MSRKPSGPTPLAPEPTGPAPAERQEMARLLRIPAERDVPAGRQRLFKDCLMNEIDRMNGDAPDASRSRRRRFALVAVPLAVAATAVTVLAVGGIGGGSAAQPAHGTTGSAPTPSRQGLAIIAYNVRKDAGGVVTLTFMDRSRPTAARLQEDLRTMGVPVNVTSVPTAHGGTVSLLPASGVWTPGDPHAPFEMAATPQSVLRGERTYRFYPARIPHGSVLKLILALPRPLPTQTPTSAT
ncbi:hypothetical protein [Streptomyces sp. NPDC021224]|uniref:hypothetical protein n=1 Tax=unclassified Streptomyces TaxID=2593676 RepID=UPI00379CB81F